MKYPDLHMTLGQNLGNTSIHFTRCTSSKAQGALQEIEKKKTIALQR